MKQNTAVICLSRVNGGMELASVKLARLLSENIHIEFIARDKSYIADKKEHFQDYDVNLNTLNFSSNLSFNLIFGIRKILVENNIKNIIFLGASEIKSLYFPTLGLDIIFIIRQGSKNTTPKKDLFHKLFYSNVIHFVGNCEYMKKNIIDILPIAKKADVTRIYSSVKLEENVTFKKYNETIDLISVGRINPGKGQLESIKACEILFKNKIKFKIKFLGDFQNKEYCKKIEDYIKDIPYKDCIEFIGYTSNIKEHLQQSDIFIFPSLGEGMSNAIIESLGFGLIPIIYDDTSSPEFKNLGFHIHLTKENNVENLQEILLQIVSNIKFEKNEAMKNHLKALEIFALKREKKEYMELLR